MARAVTLRGCCHLFLNVVSTSGSTRSVGLAAGAPHRRAHAIAFLRRTSACPRNVHRSCERVVGRRWRCSMSADPSMELPKDKRMAGSAVDLGRGSDRLAEAVKVSAPPPPALEFRDGLSKATHAFFAKVLTPEGGTRPSVAYSELVGRGLVTSDLHQVAALSAFDVVFDRVCAATPPAVGAVGGGGLMGMLRGGMKMPSLEHDDANQRWRLTWKRRTKGGPSLVADDSDIVPHSQGLYCYGGVGSGKTFLMDMFYFTLPIARKRRAHFNAFMLDVHLRVHHRRREHGDEADVMPMVAKEICDESWVLCFDEFQVADVADAMVMARLFAEFFRLGGVVVATSNRPPDQLYERGLQRSLFLPFIATLKKRCIVHDMASTTDYRLTGELKDSVYMCPLTSSNVCRADELFRVLTKGEPVKQIELETQGRVVKVPEAAVNTRVARFSFADLCSRPVGAGDYLAIAKRFHTVFLVGVPVLDTGVRINETRRFITLVDQLYAHHVKLIITAEAPPNKLLDKSRHVKQEVDLLGTAAAVQDNRDEQFAFERTVSRLNEMQTEEYLTQGHWGDGE